MPVYKDTHGRKNHHLVVVWHRGKKHSWNFEGTKAEAETFEARQRVSLGDGPSLRVSPSLQDFCVEVYEPHAKQHLKASTWELVRCYQIATLCRHLGGIRLSELRLSDIEEYKTERDVSVRASSINNELRVLRTVMSYARDCGYQVASVKWKPVPVRGHGRVTVWSEAQIARLFEHAGPLLELLVFIANTGVRKGEALACEWGWLDFQRDMVRIPSNDVWQPKNGMPREVPLSAALKRRLETTTPRSARWVFPANHGGRYSVFPKELFDRARTKAGLEGGPHTLRHSYASLFLRACPDMFLLAQVLGHSHQRVTELYSHLLPGHLERARGAVELLVP